MAAIKIKVVLACLLLITTNAYADTLLVGYDSTTAYDGPECDWLDDATTISDGKWKANRFTALASGTISYFKMRCPNTPTGCTSDDGCWAIYEGGSSSSVGSLKAYGCWSGYNWTTTGVGDHIFTITNTETNLTVTAGQYYWVVVWSQALDATYYASAGCSSQIYAYRGRDATDCKNLGLLYTLPSDAVSLEEVGYTSVPPPPAGTAFDTETATYRMMGVWAADAVCDGDNLNLCSNLADCEGAGGYWYNDTCNETAPENPEITDTDVSFTHNSNVVISGYSFGTKDPAAPRVWDACDSTSTNDLDTFYADGDRGPLCCSGGTIPNPGEADCEIGYQVSGWKSQTPPHSNTTKFLGACLTTANGAWAGSATGDLMVSIYPWNSFTVFVMYYYRVADTFHPVSCLSNFKEFVWGWGGTGYLGNDSCSDGYQTFGWCTPPPEMGSGVDVYSGSSTDPGSSWCSSVNRVYFHNPIDGWVHFEHTLNQDGLTSYSTTDDSNVSGYNVVKGGPISSLLNTTCNGTYSSNEPDMLTIGGFRRNTEGECYPSAATGNYNMWAGIYADDTFSRVMLGNASSWANCTIREPQIPSAWDGTSTPNSITVKANLGALTGETAYLFVFDSDNNANAIGYEVTLGESTTPSTMSGVMVKSGPFK